MDESAKAAAAFAEYCAMEKRSLAKLAQKWGKSKAYVGQLERWSSAFNWVERAKQYDEEQREEKRHKRAAEIERMDEEHATMGRVASIRAVDLLKKRIEENDIGAYALVQLLKIGTDLERLARGAATERSEITGMDGESLQGTQVIVQLTKKEHEEGYNG